MEGRFSESFRRNLVGDTETLLELVDASAGVYQLLLTRVKGMTLGADIDTDVLLGRTYLDDLTASAANLRLLVLGMDICLHMFPPLPGLNFQCVAYNTISFPNLQEIFSIFINFPNFHRCEFLSAVK